MKTAAGIGGRETPQGTRHSKEIAMNERITRGLSWGAALLCVHYIVWGGYHVFRYKVPVLAQLFFSGRGFEPPVSTRFVVAVSNFYIWPIGALLILLVVGKEFMLRDVMIRLAITFVVLLSVAWFFEFTVSAMLDGSMIGRQ
jgi:hypothetical protein